MQKVIDRKLYDTKTAEVVYEWDNGKSPRDFKHCRETLYLTKAGAWFLHGLGGPDSPYRQDTGDNAWSGGQDIKLLDQKAAVAWLEEKAADVDTFERHFPGVVTEG